MAKTLIGQTIKSQNNRDEACFVDWFILGWLPRLLCDSQRSTKVIPLPIGRKCWQQRRTLNRVVWASKPMEVIDMCIWVVCSGLKCLSRTKDVFPKETSDEGVSRSSFLFLAVVSFGSLSEWSLRICYAYRYVLRNSYFGHNYADPRWNWNLVWTLQ